MILQKKSNLIQDKYSTKKLCNTCNHHSCCIGFASPLLFSQDLARLKLLDTDNNENLTTVTIKGKSIKTIKKKSDSQTCVFWDQKKGCKIYNNRPFDCKMFPFDIHLINGEYHWIVYSCNPDTDWTWCENHLSMLENDPSFNEVLENIQIFSDLEWSDFFKAKNFQFTVLRKVKQTHY